jgi:hypothetical protein
MNSHDVLLKRAEKHIFSTGMNDATSHLAKVNMKYGLAKMHIVQRKFGIRPDATFISSPDETISRNVTRWEQGISYGGKITWGNGKDKLMILDVKPNACGMLIGGLNEIPSPARLLERVYELNSKEHYIDNVNVEWDFYKGNHFIDVFEVENPAGKIPKYAVIMHAGCPEFKEDGDGRFGLYWNDSRILQGMMDTVKTPFGNCYILTDNNAAAYLRMYQRAERFADRRREIAFKELFDGKIICNLCHQGLTNMNEIRLGCHDIKDTKMIFPISIRADIPSFIARGRKNFTAAQIESLGFAKRAHELGVYERLRNANIAPHGGGYYFPDSLKVNKVFEVKGKRYFEIEMQDGIGMKIVPDVNQLQFTYRGREVVEKTVDIGLCELITQLNPVYVLKV